MAWLTSCSCVLQTSALSERAERTASTTADQDGVDSRRLDGDNDAKPTQMHLKENGSASAHQDSNGAAGAEQTSAGPTSALGVNGSGLHSAPQPEQQLQGTAADHASETEGRDEPPLSGKEKEVLGGSGGEEKGSFRFSKGAYFIGKCVWGKVTHFQRALPHRARTFNLSSGICH